MKKVASTMGNARVCVPLLRFEELMGIIDERFYYTFLEDDGAERPAGFPLRRCPNRTSAVSRLICMRGSENVP